jgi:hypothetical protein
MTLLFNDLGGVANVRDRLGQMKKDIISEEFPEIQAA